MIREAEIARAFADWLQRYTPPRAIAGKADIMQKETDSLIKVLTRNAPTEGYLGWLEDVLEKLAASMKTRAWPTVNEITTACAGSRSRTIDPSQPTAMDVYQLAANRMKAGEPVGECYLYGREAVEIIARGLIDQDTMTRYRSAAFFARKKAHGEESALRWEAEAKQRHEDAKALRKERLAA